MKTTHPYLRTLTIVLVSAASASPLAVPVSGQGTWETSLQPRDWSGNGVGVDAYFDPFLNLTWLADANAGAGSAFDDGSNPGDGRMTWDSAIAWSASLTLFGGSDWRLPSLTPVDNGANFNTSTFSNNGTTDIATAKTGSGWDEHSEMGYMHYVHLGNRGSCTPDDANPTACVPQAGSGLSNTGPFANLLASVYWTDTAAGPADAWSFFFASGAQNNDVGKNVGGRAWAVHAGDLIGPTRIPVPVPGAVVLLGSALVGLAARSRQH